eukprot:snap_masked-scaffold_1-processed-gene-17.43-mRNA-1 protein AED:1.00 eAED:1.00 QI:0/-1/0/0/-1/1/1/0/645
MLFSSFPRVDFSLKRVSNNLSDYELFISCDNENGLSACFAAPIKQSFEQNDMFQLFSSDETSLIEENGVEYYFQSLSMLGFFLGGVFCTITLFVILLSFCCKIMCWKRKRILREKFGKKYYYEYPKHSILFSFLLLLLSIFLFLLFGLLTVKQLQICQQKYHNLQRFGNPLAADLDAPRSSFKSLVISESEELLENTSLSYLEPLLDPNILQNLSNVQLVNHISDSFCNISTIFASGNASSNFFCIRNESKLVSRFTAYLDNSISPLENPSSYLFELLSMFFIDRTGQEVFYNYLPAPGAGFAVLGKIRNNLFSSYDPYNICLTKDCLQHSLKAHTDEYLEVYTKTPVVNTQSAVFFAIHFPWIYPLGFALMSWFKPTIFGPLLHCSSLTSALWLFFWSLGILLPIVTFVDDVCSSHDSLFQQLKLVLLPRNCEVLLGGNLVNGLCKVPIGENTSSVIAAFDLSESTCMKLREELQNAFLNQVLSDLNPLYRNLTEDDISGLENYFTSLILETSATFPCSTELVKDTMKPICGDLVPEVRNFVGLLFGTGIVSLLFGFSAGALVPSRLENTRRAKRYLRNFVDTKVSAVRNFDLDEKRKNTRIKMQEVSTSFRESFNKGVSDSYEQMKSFLQDVSNISPGRRTGG